MHDAHPLKSLSQGVSTQLKSLIQCKFCQISKSNNNSHDRIKKKRLMNCFGRKADMFIKHFNVRKKIQLNIIQEIKFQNVNVFNVNSQLFTIKPLLQ